MNSVVCIPTCHRPELLALTLEKLALCVDVPEVNIYLDAVGPERLDEVEYVRDMYYPLAYIHQARPHTPAPSGTWNILNAIKQGYELGAENVFLVEEDILVRPNFFKWHLDAMAEGFLASCGRKDRIYYPLYPGLYTNPGSCLSRRLVEKVIPHINDIYFTDPRPYLNTCFGEWNTQSCLDDGLIRRVVRQMGGECKYPVAGVCAHQGFRFYNKLDIYMNRETTIEKKIARLRELIASLKPGDRYCKDFEPF